MAHCAAYSAWSMLQSHTCAQDGLDTLQLALVMFPFHYLLYTIFVPMVVITHCNTSAFTNVHTTKHTLQLVPCGGGGCLCLVLC